MSQAKVDRYKQEKANRDKIMRREKMMSVCRRVALTAVMLALVAWLGLSAYNKYQDSVPRAVAEVNYTAFEEYTRSLTEEETEEGEEAADAGAEATDTEATDTEAVDTEAAQ